MAPLSRYPNTPNDNGWTPIHRASLHGHAEIVKILAPLTDIPNFPDNQGVRPIDNATLKGHTEIVEILSKFNCQGCQDYLGCQDCQDSFCTATHKTKQNPNQVL